MSRKIKIIVAGIGGVGGYFGGLLAKKYYQSNEVAINFIARGKHLDQIQQKGLTIIDKEEEMIVHPALATNNPAEIGFADYIIISTKNYDLEEIITQLRPCIDQHTVLLPLLNGVDNVEKLKVLLPGISILRACVYVVSRLEAPGIIHNTGNLQKIYFGSDDVPGEQIRPLEKIFLDAGVEATFSTDIITLVWEKFIFISPLATATSYFDSCIGQIVEDPKKMELICKLIEEVKQIATAKHILFDEDITNKIIHRLNSLPYQNTSSMHSDYRSGKKKTELSSLTEYVIKSGEELKIGTPTYIMAYEALLEKNRLEKRAN